YFFIPAVEVLEPQADNKRRRSAIAGTTDCAQEFHHAFDSRPRCRLHSMALYLVPRTFPVAVRFRSACVRRPWVTLSNISTATVKRHGSDGMLCTRLKASESKGLAVAPGRMPGRLFVSRMRRLSGSDSGQHCD